MKIYLDWAYAKYEEAFDASDFAVSELDKWSNCNSESCKNSALIMAASSTDQILRSLKDAIYLLEEAEKLASKNCSNSNSLFKSTIQHLVNAEYQYSKADKRLNGAIENSSKLLTQKEQVELAKTGIVESLGGNEHMRKYTKEINLHVQEMLNCQ